MNKQLINLKREIVKKQKKEKKNKQKNKNIKNPIKKCNTCEELVDNIIHDNHISHCHSLPRVDLKGVSPSGLRNWIELGYGATLYETNWSKFRCRYFNNPKKQRIGLTYHFRTPLSPNNYLGIDRKTIRCNLWRVFYDIYKNHNQTVFKINLAFTFVITNEANEEEEEEMRVWYSSNNEKFFIRPYLITNKMDMEIFVKAVKHKDILECLSNSHSFPESRWRFLCCLGYTITGIKLGIVMDPTK